MSTLIDRDYCNKETAGFPQLFMVFFLSKVRNNAVLVKLTFEQLKSNESHVCDKSYAFQQATKNHTDTLCMSK